LITLGDKDNPVRIAFFRGFVPKPFAPSDPKSKPRFDCTFLLDPSNKVHAANIELLKKIGPEIATKAYGEIPEDLQKCWYKGDKKAYEGFSGMFVVATHLNAEFGRPVIVGRKGTPVVEGDADAPFSGCYGIGKISLWAIDNGWTPRVSGNFKALQYVKAGTAFGGAAPINPDEEFEAIDDRDEAPSTGKSGVTTVKGKNPFEDD
jgi:hypothetical protein